MPATTEPPRPIAERLADALRDGTPVDLITDTARDVLGEDEMRGWDATHDVDAGLVRDLLLGRGAGGAGADPRGLRLRGARIRGRLDLDRVVSGVALRLDDCLLDDGVTVRQARFPTLRLRRCRLGHATKPAFRADDLTVDGALDLRATVCVATSDAGAVCLRNARIGRLDLAGATVYNSGGPAVHGEGLRVDGNVRLTRGFVGVGRGDDGAVRLQSARIGGQLNLRTAGLCNPSGPALHASWLRTGGTVYLESGFVALGHGDRGAVRLLGAHVGGHLSLRTSGLGNRTGPALLADGLAVDGRVLMDASFAAGGAGKSGVVRLPGARVGGTLEATGCRVTSTGGDQYRWVLDGCTYAGVPKLSEADNRRAWLQLLRECTPDYASQPYQQLAAAYRAEGHDTDVRAILMAQREDQIARGGLSRADELWARGTGWLLGYGYQPWRALVGLVVVLAVSVFLAVVLGARGALAAPASPCHWSEQVARGLDLGTPFLPRASSRCTATTSGPGVVLTVSSWFLQLVAWALAALFVAGFTGIVRRT